MDKVKCPYIIPGCMKYAYRGTSCRHALPHKPTRVILTGRLGNGVSQCNIVKFKCNKREGIVMLCRPPAIVEANKILND